MSTQLSEKQALLEKALNMISSIIHYEQIKPVLVWIQLYKNRLRALDKDQEADVPPQVYKRLDDQVRTLSKVSSSNKTDPTRISNNYRLRDKIEKWKERRGHLGNVVNNSDK